MLKFISAAALAAAFAVSSWAATYKNSTWGFTASFPDGWLIGEMQGPLVATALAPPPESGVLCNMTAEKIALTQKMTQSEINKQNSEGFPPQWWLTNVFSTFQKVTFEKTGQRIHPSGISVQESIAALDVLEGGQTFRAKGHTVIFITPGVTYSMTCLTLETKFETYRKVFASAIDSFRKGGGLSADLNAAAPAVINVLNLDIQSLGGAASDGVKLK
jgi:hypothetical protein